MKTNNFDSDTYQPIFLELLGEKLNQLPVTVRSFHTSLDSQKWSGQAKITRGTNLFTQWVALIFNFPKASDSVRVSVHLDLQKKNGKIVEKWQRNFAGKTFTSLLSLGKGRYSGLMEERFGLVKVYLAMLVRDKKLYFQPERWSFMKIPLPKFLLPEGESYETEIDGRFHFDVKLALPYFGLIVAYQGWLEKDS